MDHAGRRAIAEELMKHAPDAIAGVEITPDGILMMPSPSGTHELVAMRLRHQLDPQLAEGLVAHTGGDVEDPALGLLRRPDLVVLPEAAMDTAGSFRPRDLELVAEIASPATHSNDYTQKVYDYAAMGIALYLLIDPRKGTAAVMSDPGTCADGRFSYRARHNYVFGDKVSVGPWTVDTSEFRRYPS
ncbi:hypothetical protein GCM10010218_27270 [Streptomyces mashuensis]|uniref:Putative restriction endonuclease domain-containing protein n=1 Tax=Streptomyces mashuensis TaxID=33904 RepID=A0A919B235_9ACTN|nr:Uma2 family endonuclease [Streptomyces mashuensis]GHF44462.1 hypothetical protein GCM10010218_27270 [Streptomyces mashuensis]